MHWYGKKKRNVHWCAWCLLLASLALWLDKPHCAFKAVFLLGLCPQDAKLLSFFSEQFLQTAKYMGLILSGKINGKKTYLFPLLYHPFTTPIALLRFQVCRMLTLSPSLHLSLLWFLQKCGFLVFVLYHLEKIQLFIKWLSIINVKKYVTFFFLPPED